jgi:PAS domain S-box-containing protein
MADRKSTDSKNVTRESNLFGADGELSRLMQARDWSSTSLGPVASWPQSLKIIIRIMLDSRYAMWLGWGAEFTFFYNDAYARMTLGAKHPWALGRPASEVWSEIWDAVGPRAESVVRTGTATWDDRLLLFLERKGFSEETFHTFSYSPVPDDHGGVGGMLCVVTEDTERTIGERRLKTLRELAARTTEEARSADEACQAAASVLATNPHDLPFALLYLMDVDGRSARLAGAAGLQSGSSAAPARVELAEAQGAAWPLRSVLQSGRAEIISEITPWLGSAPVGIYPEPPRLAVILPVKKPGQDLPAGFLVAGVSPRRSWDDQYRGFLDLVAAQAATAIANARAYEEERSRAEALAELDRAKTAFFSNVSHEFRTPLTLMLGPLEDALAGATDGVVPVSRETLDVMRRNGARLQKLVNALLDFSRIEAGRMQACYEPTDLASFTAELASNFRSACERAKLELAVNCPPLAQPVFVDRDMWEKVVLNLLSNAFKYTLAGRIDVTLRQADAVVELEVRDTGTGIPPEQMAHLFERFHRVEGAKGRTQEGSGIGLALVRELVHLHGGDVAAESRWGEGSAFRVTIPLGAQHLPSDRVKATNSSAHAVPDASVYIEEASRWLPDSARRVEAGRGPDSALRAPGQNSSAKRPRIVLADDNADMRDYVRRLLAERYDVTAVADGLAALSAARELSPELVLADVMMPGLDGFGLLKELRAGPRTARIPVLLLSARAGEESRLEGVEAGADDYLVKPFSARELLARVAAHLQINRLRRESEQSEERFRVLFETMSEGFAIDEVLFDEATGCARDLRYLEVNQAFEKHTGLQRSNILGRTTLELFPDAEPHWFERFGKVVSTGAPDHFQAKFGPLERWFEVSAYRTGPARIATVFFDITERKQAEEREHRLAAEAAAANAQFRAFFEQGAIFAGIMDRDGTVIEPNRLSLEACGYSREQVVGKLFWECPWWSKSPALVERIKEASARAAAGETFRAEMPYYVADGSERTVDLIILPVKDEAGRVKFLAPTGTDISDRKRAEQQLAEAHQFLHSSIDALTSHIAVLDENGVILAVNDAWRRFADENQFVGNRYGVGSNYIEHCQPSANECGDGQIVVNGIRDVLSGRKPSFEIEYPCHSPGEQRWFVMRITRFKSPGPVRVVVSHEDVTMRKQAEDALKDANRRKDEFLATLAHELRNPLAPIRNSLQILKMPRVDAATVERSREMMERQVHQLVRLVDDLLDVSRVMRGKIELRMERVELATVVARAVETVQPLIEAQGHELTVSLPPDSLPLHADPVRLAQVVGNLLTNAAKYTEPNGRIRMTALRDGSEAVLRVSDTGIGIAPDMLPHIFDLFVQVDHAATRSQGGLGIGLTLVKNLVDMHHGTVEAFSPGLTRGSEFVVRLPLMAQEQRPELSSDSTEKQQEPVRSSGRRLLVVDDNRDAADSLATLLRLQGHDVRVAHDGLAALEAAMSYRPEMVFLDIGMPAMDGYEVARRLRQQSNLENIRLVALTGWGQKEDRRRTKEAGFDYHLVKPAEPSSLEALLASLKTPNAK